MKLNDDFKLEVDKLKYLYEYVTSAIIGALLVAVLMYLAIIGKVDDTILNTWIILTLLVTLFRLIFSKIFKEITITSENISKYYFIFFSMMSLSAILWTAIPILLFPQEIEYQVLILLMLGGLSTGASVSLAVKYNYYVVYSVLLILPVIVKFYILNSPAALFIVMGGTVYIVFLLVISKKISMKILENIALSHSNEELIKKLEYKVDEANNANEAKSTFLSVMSHEIRTPLNAIIGFVKILKALETNKTKKDYLNTIDSSSHLLMNVINDILDITKIESGNFVIELTSFESYTELFHIYDLYEKSAQEKEILLINSISLDMPIHLKGDVLRLKQIVSNLLSNAIKFTPKGKTIEFISHYNLDTSMLYVEIKDEGIGIKKDNIERITQEFVQADDSTARKYGGTGLGLSIVTKLLKLQNSKLEIKSELGKGSSFYFLLPIEISKKQKSKQKENLNADFTNKKILVAEDNKTNQLLIDIILDEMNIDVHIANDGIEAEILVKENSYDMILMDINMPNKNGIEAMLSIKEFNTTIPIIALTANALSDDRQKYIEEGFDEYLSKPIDNEKLLLVLNQFLI